jgi:hypothetical protein
VHKGTQNFVFSREAVGAHGGAGDSQGGAGEVHVEVTQQTHASQGTDDFQGQQYLSNIIFSYFTGSMVFDDPAEPCNQIHVT